MLPVYLSPWNNAISLCVTFHICGVCTVHMTIQADAASASQTALAARWQVWLGNKGTDSWAHLKYSLTEQKTQRFVIKGDGEAPCCGYKISRKKYH